MKKTILSAISFLIILSFSVTLIHAQEPNETPQASPTPTIQYKMPYPGMLPDNSLYKLKVLRDKIILALIQDPNKKAGYYLLLANKQLLMSRMLIDKGNIPLARETALKGENQITLMTFVFKNAGREPQANFLDEVKLASLKHQELLEEIISKVNTNDAKIFSDILKFVSYRVMKLKLLV